MLATVLDESAGAVPIVTGVSDPDPAVAAARAARAEADGAAAAMVLLPPELDHAAEHLGTVAAAAPALALVLQDYPNAGHPPAPVALLAEVAAAVPAVRAVKEEAPPTADRTAELRRLAPEVRVLGGLGGLYLAWELRAGSHGVMTGFALPELLVRIVDAAARGDLAEAERLHALALPALVWESSPAWSCATARRCSWRAASSRTRARACPGPAPAAAADDGRCWRPSGPSWGRPREAAGRRRLRSRRRARELGGGRVGRLGAGARAARLRARRRGPRPADRRDARGRPSPFSATAQRSPSSSASRRRWATTCAPRSTSTSWRTTTRGACSRRWPPAAFPSASPPTAGARASSTSRRDRPAAHVAVVVSKDDVERPKPAPDPYWRPAAGSGRPLCERWASRTRPTACARPATRDSECWPWPASTSAQEHLGAAHLVVTALDLAAIGEVLARRLRDAPASARNGGPGRSS